MVQLVLVISMFCLCFLSGYYAAREMEWEEKRRLLVALGSGAVMGCVAFLFAVYPEPLRMFLLLQFPTMVYLSITDLYTNEIREYIATIPVIASVVAGIAVLGITGLAGLSIAFVYSLLWYSVRYIAKKEVISPVDLPVLWLVGANGTIALLFAAAAMAIASFVYMLRRRRHIPAVPWLTIGVMVYHAVCGGMELLLPAG